MTFYHILQSFVWGGCVLFGSMQPLPLQAIHTVQQSSTDVLRGKVTDSQGGELPGVTVKVEGTRRVTVTDAQGNYTLNVRPGETVRFSYLGMKGQSFKYRRQARANISMQEDDNMLNEVSVKARTNINAIDVRARAGVVDQVNMKLVTEKPSIDMGLALQGAVPGLLVMNTGELGKTPELRIRGNSSLRRGNVSNEPLYVLDGKIITAETFYNLNPMDISEMKVLKDAVACALYGVKAANGVIEITSKRGNSEGTTINYNFNMGITTRGRRGLKLMETSEKLELERLMRNPAAPGYRYCADYYNRYESDNPNKAQLIAEGEKLLNNLRQTNTDWFKELLRNSIYTRHTISMRGGNEESSYFASFNYTKQGGRIKGNDKEHIGVSLNLDKTLGKIGYAMISMNGSYAKVNTPVGTSNDPTQLVYDLNPYESPASGKLYSYPGRTFSDLFNQYQEKSSDKSVGVSLNLSLTPIKGLDIEYVGGIDYLLDESNKFTPGSSYSERNSGVAEYQRGILQRAKNTTTNISSNLRVTYEKTFNEKHSVTVGANFDYYRSIYDNIGTIGYGVGDINSTSAINHSITGVRRERTSGKKDRNAQIGAGLLASYTYSDLYDAYASYKRDGSSILPADKRWNNAWAVGLGWTPSNYNFLKGNKLLTRLNLRTSYGVIANLNGVSASSTVATFSYLESSYENQRQLSLISLFNENLKPEVTKSFDVMLTTELMKRLTLNINLYKRRTEQALLDVPIPTSTGFNTLKRNIGILDNNGIEASANWRVLQLPDWSLSLFGSLAYNNNKVIDLYYAHEIYTSDDAIVPDYEVGKSYDMIYGPRSLGINPLTGYPVFSTPNGEKQASEPLTREDVVALGHSTPPYSGSFGMNLGYKSFELDMNFYYNFGGKKQFNYTYVRNYDHVKKNAASGQIDNMWFKSGDENKIYPTPFWTSAVAEDNLSRFANSRTLGNSNFIRLSMLSLRYRIPGNLLKRNLPFIRFASVALQASNLFNWTSYSESDPESGTLAGTLQPVYTLNVNLTF